MFCISYQIRSMMNGVRQSRSSCRNKMSLASGRTEESTGGSTREYFDTNA